MSRETGVHDTVHDLIVDMLGAIIVGLLGYPYARRGRFPFLIDVLRAFMQEKSALVRPKRTGAR
jgi:hypothetical protein